MCFPGNAHSPSSVCSFRGKVSLAVVANNGRQKGVAITVVAKVDGSDGRLFLAGLWVSSYWLACCRCWKLASVVVVVVGG
jgi:hypothetical protein